MVTDLEDGVQMASLMALVNDRVTWLESRVGQQQECIMNLEYKLDSAQGKAAKMPYLSGRFGYGLGRPAVKREVLLFAKRAQTRRERDEWPTIFIGKHRTDIAGAPRALPLRACSMPAVHVLLVHDSALMRPTTEV